MTVLAAAVSALIALAAFMTVLAALTLLRFLAYWFAVSDALWEDRPLEPGDTDAFAWHSVLRSDNGQKLPDIAPVKVTRVASAR